MLINLIKSFFFQKEEKIKLQPIYITKENYNEHIFKLGRDYNYTKNCFSGEQK